MAWNTALFLLLNAATRPSPVMQAVAVALASSPVVLAPALLAGLWIWGEPVRRAALLAAAAGVFVGQTVNVLLGLAWFEPRPFMVGVGHTWLAHAPDNRFPSDHATLAWSLGLGLAFTGAARVWAVAVCLCGIAAAWARVYLGVHDPVDVLVSAPVGLVAGTAARRAVPVMRAWVCPPIERLYEAVLGYVPVRLPVRRRPAR